MKNWRKLSEELIQDELKQLNEPDVQKYLDFGSNGDVLFERDYYRVLKIIEECEAAAILTIRLRELRQALIDYRG